MRYSTPMTKGIESLIVTKALKHLTEMVYTDGVSQYVTRPIERAYVITEDTVRIVIIDVVGREESIIFTAGTETVRLNASNSVWVEIPEDFKDDLMISW